MSGVETPGVYSEHDDLDDDIERLNIVLQGEDGDEEIESDTELQSLDRGDNETFSRSSLPSTSRPSTSRHSTSRHSPSRHSASRPSTSSDVTASSYPTTSMCTETDELVLRFDPTSISAESSLAMNRAYQEVLLDTLRQIEMALQENRARQKQLEDDLEEKSIKGVKPSSAPKVKSLTDYTAPYFRDADGNGAPCNEDVALKSNLNEAKQFVKPKTAWSKIQRKVLLNAVKVDALEKQIRPLMNKLECETERLARCKTQEEIDESKARIADIKDRIADKQKMESKELLASVDVNKIDFMKISAIEFDGKYTPMECESMWRNVLQPGINRDKWSEEEDQCLVELAQKHSMRNWKAIAQELGTGRTPFQCLQHYQQKNYIYDQSEWTPEEDELLKEVVDTCQFGTGNIQWQQVTYYMERRSSAQCKMRWLKICPYIRKGFWTDQEDVALTTAVQMIGDNDWMRVQEFVPFRNAAQCRERWNNNLDPTLKIGHWTYDEDKKLLNLIAEYGKEWANVATQLPGRTDNMCMCRYKLLMRWKKHCDEFNKEPINVKKELISSFFEIKDGECFPKKKILRRLQRRREKEEERKKKEEERKKKEEESNIKQEGKKKSNDDEDYVVSDNEDRAEENIELDKWAVFAHDKDIFMEDYLRQLEDAKNGELVVPRPPPMKKFTQRNYQTTWLRRKKLQGLVQACVKMAAEKEGGADTMTTTDNISSALGPIMNIDQSDKEKWDLISQGLKGRMPHELTVRQLLEISRAIKETGTIPPHLLKDNDEDEDERDDDVYNSGESDDDEDVELGQNGEVIGDDDDDDDSEYECEPKYPRPRVRQGPRTFKAIQGDRIRLEARQRHYEVHAQIKNIIRRKRAIADLGNPDSKWRKFNVKRCFQLFPEQESSSFRDTTKVANKSLAILLKSFDIDTKSVYKNASRVRRRHSALALLNSTNRRRSERQLMARNHTYLLRKSDETDTADLVLGLRRELGIEESEIEFEDEEDIQKEVKDFTERHREQYGLKVRKGKRGRPKKKDILLDIKQERVDNYDDRISEQGHGMAGKVLTTNGMDLMGEQTNAPAVVSVNPQSANVDVYGDKVGEQSRVSGHKVDVQSGVPPLCTSTLSLSERQHDVNAGGDASRSLSGVDSTDRTVDDATSRTGLETSNRTKADTSRTGDATARRTSADTTKSASEDTSSSASVDTSSTTGVDSTKSNAITTSNTDTTTTTGAGSSSGVARPSCSSSTANPDGTTSRTPRVEYDRMLPYIPPNLANLSGMKTLLLDHQGLIQKASTFFNKEEFKNNLYRIKSRGANPLLPVFISASKVKGRHANKTMIVENDEGDFEGKRGMVMKHPKHVLMEKIRQTREYQLLKARFQSLFVWPALIATMRVPESVLIPTKEEMVEEEEQTIDVDELGDFEPGEREREEEDLESLQAEDHDQVMADGAVEENVARAVEDVMETEGENLSHEQAIEKLVDKIMEEYRVARQGKKRNFIKSRRHLSEAVREGTRQRERTKILKRLGLYDVMEGYRHQREQQQQLEQTSPLPQTGTSITETGPTMAPVNSSETQAHTGTSNFGTLITQPGTSTVTETGTGTRVMGAQPFARPEDKTPMEDESEVVIKIEAEEEDQGPAAKKHRSEGVGTEDTLSEEVPVKKKKGRPKGAKNYQKHEHEEKRKSTRQIETPTVLGDSVVTPVKKSQRPRTVKLTKLKQLIPSKMSNLIEMLPEVPLIKQAEQEAAKRAEEEARKEAEKEAENKAKSEARKRVSKRGKKRDRQADNDGNVGNEKGKEILEKWKKKKAEEEKKRHQVFQHLGSLQMMNVLSRQQGGSTVVVKVETEGSSDGVLYDADVGVDSGQSWASQAMAGASNNEQSLVNQATVSATDNGQSWVNQAMDHAINNEQSNQTRDNTADVEQNGEEGVGSELETHYVVHSGEDYYVERQDNEEEMGEEEEEDMEGNYTAELLDMSSNGGILSHSHSSCGTYDSVSSSNIVSTSHAGLSSNSDVVGNKATISNMSTASRSHVANGSNVVNGNTVAIETVTSANTDTSTLFAASNTETEASEPSDTVIPKNKEASIVGTTSKTETIDTRTESNTATNDNTTVNSDNRNASNQETTTTTTTPVNNTASTAAIQPCLSLSVPNPSADQAKPGSTVLVPMPVTIGGQTQMAFLPMQVGPNGQLSFPTQSQVSGPEPTTQASDTAPALVATPVSAAVPTTEEGSR